MATERNIRIEAGETVDLFDKSGVQKGVVTVLTLISDLPVKVFVSATPPNDDSGFVPLDVTGERITFKSSIEGCYVRANYGAEVNFSENFTADSFSGGESGIGVPSDHVFNSEAERDAFFTANPDKLVEFAECIVLNNAPSGLYQIYNGTSWENMTRVVIGHKGDKGEPGNDGDMVKNTYDSNGDGSVNLADAINGHDSAGANKFYGTNETGVVGFYDQKSTQSIEDDISSLSDAVDLKADSVELTSSNSAATITAKLKSGDNQISSSTVDISGMLGGDRSSGGEFLGPNSVINVDTLFDGDSNGTASNPFKTLNDAVTKAITDGIIAIHVYGSGDVHEVVDFSGLTHDLFILADFAPIAGSWLFDGNFNGEIHVRCSAFGAETSHKYVKFIAMNEPEGIRTNENVDILGFISNRQLEHNVHALKPSQSSVGVEARLLNDYPLTPVIDTSSVDGNVIPFLKSNLDSGGNMRDGIFTAPFSGAYHISYHLTTREDLIEDHKQFTVRIYRRSIAAGEEILRIANHPSNTCDFTQSDARQGSILIHTESETVMLDAGDEVLLVFFNTTGQPFNLNSEQCFIEFDSHNASNLAMERVLVRLKKLEDHIQIDPAKKLVVGTDGTLKTKDF